MLSGRQERMKIELDGLEKAVNEILDEYGAEVNAQVAEVVPDIAKEAAKQVKANALAKGLKRKKGGKHYVNGWKSQVETKRLTVTAVVYNSTKPQLTHLLENGHAKVNGGRVEGRPHIAPVNEWAEKELIERIERRLSE